jgi:hypothetical protein
MSKGSVREGLRRRRGGPRREGAGAGGPGVRGGKGLVPVAQGSTREGAGAGGPGVHAGEGWLL